MSDILTLNYLETWRKFGLVAKASGSAITSGTCNYYLKALSGDNAGKWWRNSDQTWQVAETANAMTHQADGSWTINLAAAPWTAGEVYLEYAKESGDLHIAGEGRLVRARQIGVTVAPIVGSLPPRQEGVTIPLYVGETKATQIDVVDGNGDAVDFTSLGAITLTIRDTRGTLVQVASTTDASLTVAVGSVTFTPDAAATTLKARTLNYSIVRHTGEEVYQEGTMPIRKVTARGTP